MSYFRTFACIVGMLLATAPGAFCQKRTVSADTLPREHWSYDAMAHLAVHGIVPGPSARFYQGDFLLDELEMAQMVREILADSESLSRAQVGDRMLLSRLAQQFRPQLLFLGTSADQIDALQPTDAETSPIFTGYARPILRFTSGDQSLLGTYEADILAPLGRHGILAATLQTADKEYRQDPQDFSKISKLFVKGFGRSWEWEIGRDYLFWGPGYSGSMILSDNAPDFNFAKFQRDFSFGRRIGRVQIAQIVAPFEEDGKHLWFLGRRWQKTFSPHFNIGINETVKAGEKPRPIVLIMPTLYHYQTAFLDEVDPEWNNLVSIDMLYRTGTGREFYSELVVDDLTSPTPFRTRGERPRKAGLLLGVYLPQLGVSERTSARAEVIIADPETYLSTREEFSEINYLRDGHFIGHPVGNDAEALFLRVTHRFEGGLAFAGEFLAARRRTTGANDHSANFLATYDVSNRISASLRWREFRQSPDGRLELAGSYAF